MISDTLYEAAKDIRTYLELMPDVYRIYADRLNALVDEMDRIRALPGMDGSPVPTVSAAIMEGETLVSGDFVVIDAATGLWRKARLTEDSVCQFYIVPGTSCSRLTGGMVLEIPLL
jgi:hypothetical protein